MDLDQDSGSDSGSENEYDSDLDNQPPRKKQKNNNFNAGGRGFFIDGEVEESDEEEEDGEPIEYEGSTDNNAYKRIREDSYRNRGPSIADFTREQLEETARRYDRYDEEEFQEEEINQHSYDRRAPTVKDPRIWKVACRKPGEEKRIVAAIMKRFNDKALLKQPLSAYSAFSMDHIKGYVFIEAKQSADVKQALEGILAFSSKLPFTSRPEPIKVEDMISVLRIPKSVSTLDKGSWVRVKRGLYKGDLAYVHRVSPNDSKAWIKLIPRLNLTPIEEEETGKRKRKPRPPPRFFNKDEVINAGYDMELQVNVRDSTLGDAFDLYKKDRYKDGFLYKASPLASLDSNNISPTLDEIKKFQGQTADDSQGGGGVNSISSILAHTKTQKKYNFVPGEAVEVLSGPLKNLTGKIQEVNEDTVAMIPLGIEFEDPVVVEINRLRKFFKKGDHVKVLAGRHKGESGLIVEIDTEIVTIYSNSLKQTIKVLIHDIQECSSSTSDRVQLKKYKLHDLVSVGQNSAGVIVKVNSDSFQVLETSGQVRRVPLSEMGMKRRSNVSFDKNQNQVTARDEVTVVEGPYKDKEGTVKYVYKHHLFIQARGFTENGGIFVVRCNSVVANSNAGMSSRDFNRNSAPSSPYIHGNNRSHPSIRGRRSSGPRGRKDPLLRKTVKIKKGIYRGYDAIVRESNDANYRVELVAKSKIISIPRDDVFLPEPTNGGRMYDAPIMGDRTPFSGDRTPMLGDRTPMLGDRTPMVGDRTPMLGDRTPMKDSYGDDSWNTNDYSHDRRETDYSVVTPGTDSITSPYTQIGTPNVGNYPSTPGTFSMDTPGYIQPTESPYNTVTPQAYPSTPATPGMMNPQTPGFTDSYYDNDIEYLPTNIEVKVKDNYSGTAKIGIITESGSTAQVRLSSGQTTYASQNNLEATIPQKNDQVKVISGEHKNLVGTLATTSADEGIVKTGSTMITVKLNQLGKYVT